MAFFAVAFFVVALFVVALGRARRPRSLVAERGLGVAVAIATPHPAPRGLDGERAPKLDLDPAALSRLEAWEAREREPPRRGLTPSPREGRLEARPRASALPEGAPSPLDTMAPPSPIGVGDPGWTVALGTRPAAPVPARTTISRRTIPRDVSHLARDPLNARDEELGLRLPAAGVIASALASRVRAHTPPSSRAIFVAVLDERGVLRAITLASFSGGDRSGWVVAAREAEALVGDATFALRGDLPHGALVTIEVVQNLELPSGRGRRHRLHDRPDVPGTPRPFDGRRLTRDPDAGPAALPPDLERLGNPETMLPPCPGGGGPTTASALPSASGGGVFDLGDIGARAVHVLKTATTVAPRPEPAGRPPAPRPVDR